MTPNEINRRLAVECMGWTVHPRNTAHYMSGNEDMLGGYHVEAFVSDWNPYHSRVDAIRVFDRIASMSSNATICANRTESGLVYDVAFMLSDQRGVHEEHDSLSAAICLAALAWMDSKKEIFVTKEGELSVYDASFLSDLAEIEDPKLQKQIAATYSPPKRIRSDK